MRIIPSVFLVLGLVFLLIGPIKVFGILEDPNYLGFGNALLPIVSNRVVFLTVGILEIALGVHLVFSRRLIIKAVFLLWFVVSAVAYKIGLAFIDYESPCNCLSGFSKFIKVSRVAESYVSDTMLVVSLFTALSVLLADYFRTGRRNAI